MWQGRLRGWGEALAIVIALLAMFFCAGVALVAFVAGELFTALQGGLALIVLAALTCGFVAVIRRRATSSNGDR